MVEEIDRRLLAMGGFGETTLTSIQWPAIVPVSDLEERQVAVLDESLGIISKRTLAQRFDLDYDAEQKEMEQERAAESAPPCALLEARQPAPHPEPV